MMPFLYRAGFIIPCLAAAFVSGFFYGRLSGHGEQLKSTVAAFQNRERIDNEIENLDAINLCLALGGLPDKCASIVRGLEKAAPCK